MNFVFGGNGEPLSLLFTALLLLCGLGAACLSTTAGGRLEMALVPALSVIIAAARLPTDALPDARWIGCAAAAIAALLVFRPNLRWIGPVGGGALAGLLGALLETQGTPLPLGILMAFAIPAVSAYLSGRRPGFAPEALRQEAMLATAAFGLAVAMIPEVSSGWQSALALNREQRSAETSNQIIANWVLVLSTASVVLGGLYSLLRRR